MHTYQFAGPLLALAAILLPHAKADVHFRGVLTTAAPLLRRQGSRCEFATETVCPDGDGCCATDETCTVESGVPLCAGFCIPGAVTCDFNGVTACCPGLGSTCNPLSPGFCTATGGNGDGIPPPLSISPITIISISPITVSPISISPITIGVSSTPEPTLGTETVQETSTPPTSSVTDASSSETDGEAETETSTAETTRATTSTTSTRGPSTTVSVTPNGASHFGTGVTGVGAFFLAGAAVAGGILFV